MERRKSRTSVLTGENYVMTDNIYKFMHREIGLDIKNSSSEDIKAMSEIIENKYNNEIDHVQCPETLYEYWEEAFDENWQTCVFEPDMQVFNAYREESTKQFAQRHNVLTADEILNSNFCDISTVEENDIMDLIFCN